MIQADEDLTEGAGLLRRPCLARRREAVDGGELAGGARAGEGLHRPLAALDQLRLEPLGRRRRGKGVGEGREGGAVGQDDAGLEGERDIRLDLAALDQETEALEAPLDVVEGLRFPGGSRLALPGGN